MPSFTDGSFKRLSSLAFLKAASTVCKGFKALPSFLLFPFGETYISVACIDTENRVNSKPSVKAILPLIVGAWLVTFFRKKFPNRKEVPVFRGYLFIYLCFKLSIKTAKLKPQLICS